jgi:hypothetical protein
MLVSPSRDLRIDLLRGMAVLAMIVDHVAGASPLRLLTGGNQFYTSAAEGFVLLAGFTAGLVSARAVKRGTLSSTAWRFLHRAVLLYALVCAITLVFTLDQPLLSQLPDILTLKQRHSILDVLVLYAMLFVLAPLAAHLLASGRTWVLVTASVAVWGAYQFAPQVFDLPSFLGREGHFGFPLAAWQLLFCLAMAGGYHRDRLARSLTRAWRLRLLVLAGVTSVGLLVLYTHAAGLPPTLGSAGSLGSLFAKETVAPGRLVASFSIFSLLFALTSMLGARTKAVLGRVFLPLGSRSLLAFVLHLVALVGIAVGTNATGTALSLTPLANASLQALTVGFVWVSIRLCTRVTELPRSQPAGRRLALVWHITTAVLRG